MEHRKKFIESILEAGGHASYGDKALMKKHLDIARTHHKNHIAEYKTVATDADDLKREEEICNQYYDRVKDIFHGKIRKSEAVGNLSKVDHIKTKQMVSKPGQDKRYEYKHYDHLTADQQVQVKHSHKGMPDIESHHYPLDNNGGIASASRWKDPNPNISNKDTTGKKLTSGSAGEAASAEVGFTKPEGQIKLRPDKGEVLPHHYSGSPVRISSKDHEHDGSFGAVKAPNPYYPNKIHVEVMDKATRNKKSIFVEPHEAVPSKMAKSQAKMSSDNVFSLAKAALEKLNKRG